MGKTYGKISRTAGKTRGSNSGNGTFRIRLRGEDGRALSMQEMRDGLYEAARRLQQNPGCRAKWATLYLVMIDENGKEVLPDPSGEWTVNPYKCAADELGL